MRAREAVTRSNSALQERENLKRARLTEMAAESIADHGVEASRAMLAAELATAVFFTAFARWLAGDHDDLVEAQLMCLAELHDIIA